MLRFFAYFQQTQNFKFIEAVFKNSSKKLKTKYIEKQKAEKYSLKFECLFASNFLGLFLKPLKST